MPSRLRPSADFARYSISASYPNSPVCDLPRVRLVFSDKRLHPQLQIFGGCRIKAKIDLARIDQIVALSPSKTKAVELAAIKRITGEGQGFALDDPLFHASGCRARKLFSAWVLDMRRGRYLESNRMTTS